MRSPGESSRRGPGGRVGKVARELAGAAARRVVVALGRFLAGRPVLGKRTQWSSGYLWPAPPPPPLPAGARDGRSLRAAYRAYGVPVGRWPRRAGWQRQCARLVTVAGALMLVAPEAGAIALLLAVVAAAGAWVAAESARVAVTRLGRRRICDALTGAVGKAAQAATPTVRNDVNGQLLIHVESERLPSPVGR